MERSVAEVLRRLPHPSNQKLSLERIEQTLAALESESGFSSAFVREAMRFAPSAGDARRAHWAQTIAMLSKAGRQYSTGDEAFRETMSLFLKTPWLIAASQAAMVAAPSPVVVAAVLAKEGSEASYDALMTELDRAVRDGDRWSLHYRLKPLARYATKNASWLALEKAVRDELAGRDEKLAETSFARALGLSVKLLSFSLQTVGRVAGKEPAHLWLTIDDKRKSLSVHVTPIRATDQPSDIAQLARWLVGFNLTNVLTWDWGQSRIRSSLRGRPRDAFFAWLRNDADSPLGS